MVRCSPRRKVCFFWSVAGIIATETCIFFVLLLIFTAEKYENSAQIAADFDASLHSRHAAHPISLNSSKGYLTFLPSHKKTFTVDFLRSSEYKRSMEIISDEYNEKNLANCQNIPHLELHDCNKESSYGTQHGVFCLVARLEHTGKWIPDQFLPVDWLPHYKADYLPISCDVTAQNSSVSHRSRSPYFPYKKRVPTIWPASGFHRGHFGKDIPKHCYPPVTIKIDDPFVLTYPHDLVSVTCHVWSYNSKLLRADSVSINITLRNREDALSSIARKPLLPEQPVATSDEATPIFDATETATAQVILSSTTTDPEPVDVFPDPVSQSMPCITCTNPPLPLTESSVPSRMSPPTLTEANTYTVSVIPSASSHETSTSTISTEVTTLQTSPQTVPWTDQGTSQTEPLFQTTFFSFASDSDEKNGEITTEHSPDQRSSVSLEGTSTDMGEFNSSRDSSPTASRQRTLGNLNSNYTSTILINTMLATPNYFDEDATIEEGFIAPSRDSRQKDYTTVSEISQYSEDQDMLSSTQRVKTDAIQAVNTFSIVVPTPAVTSENTPTNLLPAETTSTIKIEANYYPEASGDMSTDDISTQNYDSSRRAVKAKSDKSTFGQSNEILETTSALEALDTPLSTTLSTDNFYEDDLFNNPSTTMSTTTEQVTSSEYERKTSSQALTLDPPGYHDYDDQTSTEPSTSASELVNPTSLMFSSTHETASTKDKATEDSYADSLAPATTNVDVRGSTPPSEASSFTNLRDFLTTQYETSDLLLNPSATTHANEFLSLTSPSNTFSLGRESLYSEEGSAQDDSYVDSFITAPTDLNAWDSIPTSETSTLGKLVSLLTNKYELTDLPSSTPRTSSSNPPTLPMLPRETSRSEYFTSEYHQYDRSTMSDEDVGILSSSGDMPVTFEESPKPTTKGRTDYERTEKFLSRERPDYQDPVLPTGEPQGTVFEERDEYEDPNLSSRN